MIEITRADCDPGLIPPDTQAVNKAIVKKLSETDQWRHPPALIRALRRDGKGPFPPAPRNDTAETITINGPRGALKLRIVTPASPKGVYLHIHGGGWTLGEVDNQDPWYDIYAREAGMATVSVDYGLAPEEPYPAGPDDCEAAALWLHANARARFGCDKLVIGGESAGAHLSVVTLLRLRDRHGLSPFAGANLHAGCYDLGFTPSARNWGDEKLVLNTRDMEMFVRHFLVRGGDVASADISPIHANLAGLPPALFTVGTCDMLFDDSLLMAAKWLRAGNEAEFKAYNGGCHVFIGFASQHTDDCMRRITGFMRRVTGQ